jgi:hypothetical protein
VGDLSDDGTVNNFDISPFELALVDPPAYLAMHPSMDDCDRVWRGDTNFDCPFDNFDIEPFEQLLTGGGADVVHTPEPSTFALVGMGGAALLVAGWRRRRRLLSTSD